MNVAQEIALLACKSCEKMDGESDVDFSKRLCRVFIDCHDAVLDTMEKKENEKATTSRLDIESLI
jgi:hypothetical protein